ncbi:ileal sodium/bile acid cotransporter-like [Athalia rosae]|uniref:ileal sodium/bile acid cotransporter-like n=1 Tax=Athalia rosae TaxID=37344 RepID=UPI0020338762|nr:ileal sodium/bile acid cotransporter-like [Athalia rosae]XP_048504995.1 ileal sodium/bile acid cotransporter-like [Athalia rosae]XP_048504996.1 ileal sodium/bile acid cotransporter-like [Athalia rosae]
MESAVIGLLLLMGSASAWNVTFSSPNVTIHMHETLCVPFSAPVNAADIIDGILTASSSRDSVASVPNLPVLDPSDVEDSTWKSCLNITANFLGRADVVISIASSAGNKSSEALEVIVIREERVIDTLFTVCVAVLVSVLYINFGCAMDWDICQRTLKKPVGPTIGFFCQFLYMPLLSYVIGLILFPDDAEMRIGMFFSGVSPSGGASNIWTALLDGNLNLSVTMTTISTLAAFAMMPLWIFTLGRSIFHKGDLVVPYSKIAMFAVSLIVPLAIGYIIQKKLPRVCRLLVRILKPFSSLLILFIIVFAIVTNLYLFQLFSWRIIVAGIGLPWLGYLFGMIVAWVLKQPRPDITAISIETGVQNTGISIFLLRFSLPQPAADLTTIAPVAVAIMTPIPMTIWFIGKLINDRRKKSLAASSEKLRSSADPIPTIADADKSTRTDGSA